MRVATLILVGTLGCAMGLAAQENGAAAYNVYPEPWRSRLLREWEAEVGVVKKRIDTADERAKKLKREIGRLYGISDVRGLTKQWKEIPKQLEADKRRLSELLKNDPPLVVLPPLLFADVKVDGYGRAKDINAKVSQVIGADSAILKLEDARHKYADITVMLRGSSTKGMTDGAVLRLDDRPLVVTGTTRYRTVIGGTKTVFVLEPLDLESLAGKRQPAEEKATSKGAAGQVKDVEDEIGRIEAAIRGDEERLAKAKTARERQRYTGAIEKYKKKLAEELEKLADLKKGSRQP